jgi:hypothetical protein
MKRSRKIKLKLKNKKSRKRAGDRSSFPKQQKEYPETAKDPSVEAHIAEQKAAVEALAQKALAAQAARKAAKAGPAPVPQEEPGRRDSDASTETEEVSFQENPLNALRGRKAEPTVVKGTLGQKTPGISFFGVQRHTTQKEKGGRKSRRKTHKRKRSHRR